MNRENALKVLAEMEEYRKQTEEKPHYAGHPGHIIRVCEAIFAGALGYTTRADWESELRGES